MCPERDSGGSSPYAGLLFGNMWKPGPNSNVEFEGYDGFYRGLISAVIIHEGLAEQCARRVAVFKEELVAKVWHPEGRMVQYYANEMKRPCDETSDSDDEKPPRKRHGTCR